MPLALKLHDPEYVYDIWVRWVADERRHLPSEIAHEPIVLFDAVMQIDALYHSLKRETEGAGDG